VVTCSTPSLVLYRAQWHDHEGKLKTCRSKRRVRLVEVVLEVRSHHGLDHPVEFSLCRQGETEWTSLSWDELIRSMASRKWRPFQGQPGWLNPSWWVDR